MYMHYTRCTCIIQDVHILYKMYTYKMCIRTCTVQEGSTCTALSKYLQCTGYTCNVDTRKIPGKCCMYI